MPAYISELINYLRDCFSVADRSIHFEQQIGAINLDVAQAVPVGLILNEAITNAIKYAFPTGKEGEISISLQHINKELLRLTITDNGKGLPANFDIKTVDSLGMELMKALSEQLGGSFDIKNNNGVCIIIEFQQEKALYQIQKEQFYN
jgi:two-component sensor histidine kinase